MNAHPLAELFLLPGGAEFDELCADIKQHGLLNPITEHRGLILDGRNRLRACERLGIAPRFVGFESLKLRCTLEDFIWSQNVARRHLSDDQRTMIAMQWRDRIEAKAKERQKVGLKKGKQTPVRANPPAREKSDRHETRHKLAEMAHVSQHKIRLAETVTAASPEMAAKISSGALRLREAARQIKRDKNTAFLIAARESKPSRRQRGGGVLPLEVMWPTPAGMVERIADRIESAFREPTQEWNRYSVGELPRMSKADDRIMALPGVRAVFEKLETLTAEFKRAFRKALDPVAQQFRQLAAGAPNGKVPLGAPEYRDQLVQINTQQKNWTGACGKVGCWNKIEVGQERCAEHGGPAAIAEAIGVFPERNIL